jgi:hypothetical protein
MSRGILLDTSTANKERRCSRIKCSWPVVIFTARGALVAETSNITPHGAFIVCDKPLTSKTELRLFIMFPNRRHVEIVAEVIWSYPYGSDADIPPCGMGVRFTKITDADRDFISSLSSGYLKFEYNKGTFID